MNRCLFDGFVQFNNEKQKEIMNVPFYISFDLSLRGDYQGLYRWLDKNKAEERGNGYAFIKSYNCPDSELEGATDFKEKNYKFANYVKKEILEYAEIGSSDRIYITLKLIDNNHVGGLFLFGKKQSEPWEGHYQDDSEISGDFDFS